MPAPGKRGDCGLVQAGASVAGRCAGCHFVQQIHQVPDQLIAQIVNDKNAVLLSLVLVYLLPFNQIIGQTVYASVQRGDGGQPLAGVVALPG